MTHALSRCAFVERDLANRLGVMDVYNHVDEICLQSYMDVLGYGINVGVV